LRFIRPLGGQGNGFVHRREAFTYDAR